MKITNQQKNQHLLWRAGFGPMAEEFHQLSTSSQKSYITALFKASSKTPPYIDIANNAAQGLAMGIGDIKNQQQTPEQRREAQRRSREDIKSLNLTWLNLMVNSDQQLREKMSLFWHGHFASRNINILYQQQLLDVIRRNALGNFGDLLKQVSMSAAMINFLNNNQNRKGHPNENFAREVMELFTLGRGNYTESDVKEAARAFTGWGAAVNGEFVFRKNQHDTGEKNVLGKSGNFQGEQVLDILLENKQTANFIANKVYRYFVNEQPDKALVDWLAKRFYDSNYDISALMKDIFSSDWFYDEKNIGAKIKSPVELIVGIRRAVPMEIQNEEVQLLFQRLLGQLLFYPPNVAGWPGGTNWIDSSSLMLRMRLPQMIVESEEVNVKPKDDDDQMMGMKDSTVTKKAGPNIQKSMGGQVIKANVDWAAFSKKFEKTTREDLIEKITGTLLQRTTGVNKQLIEKYADDSGRSSFIRSVAIHLMSTPEYQLC